MENNRGVNEEAGGHGLRFFDARPGQVNVEEEKEDTKADYGALKKHSMLDLDWIGRRLRLTSNWLSSLPSRLKRRCRYTCQVRLVITLPPLNKRIYTHLRLDQNQVDKQYDKVILDVFVRKVLAARTLCQAHAFAQRSIIGTAVSAVQVGNRIGAFDADGHRVIGA